MAVNRLCETHHPVFLSSFVFTTLQHGDDETRTREFGLQVDGRVCCQMCVCEGETLDDSRLLWLSCVFEDTFVLWLLASADDGTCFEMLVLSATKKASGSFFFLFSVLFMLSYSPFSFIFSIVSPLPELDPSWLFSRNFNPLSKSLAQAIAISRGRP